MPESHSLALYMFQTQERLNMAIRLGRPATTVTNSRMDVDELDHQPRTQVLQTLFIFISCLVIHYPNSFRVLFSFLIEFFHFVYLLYTFINQLILDNLKKLCLELAWLSDSEQFEVICFKYIEHYDIY